MCKFAQDKKTQSQMREPDTRISGRIQLDSWRASRLMLLSMNLQHARNNSTRGVRQTLNLRAGCAENPVLPGLKGRRRSRLCLCSEQNAKKKNSPLPDSTQYCSFSGVQLLRWKVAKARKTRNLLIKLVVFVTKPSDLFEEFCADCGICRCSGTSFFLVESPVSVSRYCRLCAGVNQPPLTHRSGLFTFCSGAFPLLIIPTLPLQKHSRERIHLPPVDPSPLHPPPCIPHLH